MPSQQIEQLTIQFGNTRFMIKKAEAYSQLGDQGKPISWINKALEAWNVEKTS